MSTYSNIALFYDLATLKALSAPRRRIANLLRSGLAAGSDAAAETLLQAGTLAPVAAGEAESGANEPRAPGETPLRVLDIGCGTGVQLQYLHDAGFECTGVDESPQMLARAATRCPGSRPLAPPEAGTSGCRLVKAQATALPFADNSFDAAVLSLILHESESDPLKMLAEATRVASRVLVLEWKMPERNLDYIYWLPMHVIERLAGKRHFQNFRSYMRGGGLEGLVYRFNLLAKKNGTPRLESAGYEFFRLGSLVLMDLRRNGK